MKLNAEQLHSLGSPVRARILSTIRIQGPMTVKKLCDGTNLSAETTHYHVRLMLRLGILRVHSTRISGTRKECLYEATSPRFEFPGLTGEVSNLPLLSSAVNSILRLAAADFEKTTQVVATTDHKTREVESLNTYVGRMTGRLSKADFDEVINRLEELEQWILQRSIGDTGRSFSMTAVLVPTFPEG